MTHAELSKLWNGGCERIVYPNGQVTEIVSLGNGMLTERPFATAEERRLLEIDRLRAAIKRDTRILELLLAENYED